MIRAAALLACLTLSALPAFSQPAPSRLGPREAGQQGGTQIRVTQRLERIALARSSADEALATLPTTPVSTAMLALAQERIGERLESLRRAGALAGRSARDAWTVRCDQTTSTLAMRSGGRLGCTVGIAIERPGEFHFMKVARSGLPRARSGRP
jgi:hypothetical protein